LHDGAPVPSRTTARSAHVRDQLSLEVEQSAQVAPAVTGIGQTPAASAPEVLRADGPVQLHRSSPAASAPEEPSAPAKTRTRRHETSPVRSRRVAECAVDDLSHLALQTPGGTGQLAASESLYDAKLIAKAEPHCLVDTDRPRAPIRDQSCGETPRSIRPWRLRHHQFSSLCAVRQGWTSTSRFRISSLQPLGSFGRSNFVYRPPFR
jgi:hypothetical protein